MTQTWNPDQYARNARFVSDLGAPVLELLDPQPRERILDLGCGDGVLTAKLRSSGCDVLGVDASAAQVEATKKLGVPAQTIDGENLPFENEFDAVFSNAALHWMRNNPDAVIAGVHRALRPGGRFVAEMGGDRCVEKIRAALIAASTAATSTENPPTSGISPLSRIIPLASLAAASPSTTSRSSRAPLRYPVT